MTSAQTFSASGGPMFNGSETCESAEHTTLPDATLSLAASHARTYLLPGKARVFALARGLVFGSNSPVLLANYDPGSSCWRTSQLSLPGMGPSLLKTLPCWGMTRDGALYQQQMPAPLIDVSGGFAWPTPTTGDANPRTPGQGELYLSMGGTIRRKNKDGTSSNLGLASTVKNWPASQARDLNDVVLRATPVARDWRSGKASNETPERNSRPLNEQVMAEETGELNPDWVEQLMGFPPGWSDPTLNFTSRDLDSHNTDGSCPALLTGGNIAPPD